MPRVLRPLVQRLGPASCITIVAGLDGCLGGSTGYGLCDLLDGFAFALPPILEEMREVLRPDFGEHTQRGPVAANHRQ